MTSETAHYDSLAQVFLRNNPDLLIIHIAFNDVFIYIKFIAFEYVCFVAEIGTDDDGEFHFLLFPVLQHSVPVHLRHQQVEEQKIGGIFVDDIDGLLPVQRSAHTDTMSGEDLLHHSEEECLILGNEDMFALRAHWGWGEERGNRNF